MSLHERIKILIQDKDIKPAGFARAIGVSRATVSDWMNGKIPTISTENAKKIADYCGSTIEWVALGKGDKYKDQKLLPTATSLSEKYSFIPRYNINGSAGNGECVYHEEVKDTVAFRKSWLAEKGLHANQLSVIYASGNSMEPRIRDGDVLLIDHAQRDIKDGKIYLIRINNDLRIKRLSYRYDGALRIISDNPSNDYPDELVPPQDISQIEVIGRVVWAGGSL